MSSGSVVSGPPQIVRVKREVLAACMTCPLCRKLIRDATTISECLHTFCRKCIFERLNDEEEECCPICQIDLGCAPLEKLRPDHSLQDVRGKIFPYKGRNGNSPEVVPSITLPVRRKERSLSSLGINTPRIGTQSGLTGRRTKAVARRAPTMRGPSPIVGEVKKKESEDEDVLDSRSPEKLIKVAHGRKMNSSSPEMSSYGYNRDLENVAEIYMNKSELWKPLNCLVEAANRTKVVKSSPQIPAIKAEQSNGIENGNHLYRTKIQEHPSKLKVQGDENNSVSKSTAMVKARRMHGVSRKRKEQAPSAQAVLDASDAAFERRMCPVWLSLLSSTKNGDTLLPQISASYLRIKEGHLPVSFLQKYLVKKLNLASETQVEIECRGELVSPTLSLHDLTEHWLGHGPPQRVQASVGTSAKQFVMVLTYRLKT